MKIFPPLFCFVLFFACAAFAQTDQSIACPTVEVRGGGIPTPNEISYFSADVDKKERELNIEYVWTVIGGEIIEGQGTPTIAVMVSGKESLGATVEIKGFPEGCSNTNTEMPLICPLPRPVLLFDEFSTSISRIEKARIDALTEELLKNPDVQGYIIEYFKPNTPKRDVDRKLRLIYDYLRGRKNIEAERFTIVTAASDGENLTKFWIVPPGAETPTP